MKKYDGINDQTIEVKKIKLSQSFLHFSILHQINAFKYQIILTILISIIFAFFGVILVQNTGLYGMGVEGIGQAFARLGSFLLSKYKDPKIGRIFYNILFWMFTLLMNVPLLIFSYFKISKKFCWLTTVFMVFSTLFGIVFSFIPKIDKLFIFGNLSQEGLDEISAFDIKIVFWNYKNDAIKQLSLFLYAITWAIVQAMLASALFIIHSSSGGFDIIGIWYSKKFFKSVGTMFAILHLTSLIIANILGTYIPTSLAAYDHEIVHVANWEPSLFLSPNFIACIVMILTNGLIVNILFPKYNIVKVEIYSKKIDEINTLLQQSNKQVYTTSISKVIGGYSSKEQKVLNTTCLYFDAASLLRFVRKIDESAFFTITDIKKADGYIYVGMNVDKKADKIKNELNNEQK